jgi:hypothetical protein
VKIVPVAFKTSFGIAAGTAAAYMLVQLAVQAIDAGAIGDTVDSIGLLREEWKGYREFRKQRSDAG